MRWKIIVAYFYILVPHPIMNHAKNNDQQNDTTDWFNFKLIAPVVVFKKQIIVRVSDTDI